MLLLAQFLNFFGYVVGGAVFIWQAKRRKLATEGMGLILLAALVGGLVGAKLTEWLFGAGAPLFNSPAAFFDPFVGGRSILGGVVVGWLSVEIAKKRLGITRKNRRYVRVRPPRRRSGGPPRMFRRRLLLRCGNVGALGGLSARGVETSYATVFVVRGIGHARRRLFF